MSALSEADLYQKALFAHRRKEVSPEYLPRQSKKNRPGTKLKVMVNEIIELVLSSGISALRCEAETIFFPLECWSGLESVVNNATSNVWFETQC